MQFSPTHPIVVLCVQGMALEEAGRPDEAGTLFLRAWNEATDDFGKFLAAHFVARIQKNVADRLRWLELSLQCGLRADDVAADSALPALYQKIANCYEELGDGEKAQRNRNLALAASAEPKDPGPFYHGTRADLQTGDLLTPGGRSNYQADIIMNHIYFTALVNGAGLAAALAKGDGRERVYIVEPTGSFENDPNVTDQKFPGNPTRSYRTRDPLKIVGEVTDWERITPEELRKWRERLDHTKGEIIN